MQDDFKKEESESELTSEMRVEKERKELVVSLAIFILCIIALIVIASAALQKI